MLFNLLFVLVIGFILTLTFMPINFKICYKFNLLDKPDTRKVHTTVKLRGGGISIYFAFIAFMLFLYFITFKLQILGIILSSMLLFITGFLDDKYNMHAKFKLVLQTISAIIIYLCGIHIDYIKIFNFSYNFSPIISFGITVFWIILLINAINLIDGLDGLASGVSIIILFTLCIFSEDIYVKCISIFIIGTLLGFLKFNFFPSKIFLGDTGSMFLGFIIAVLSIYGLGKTAVGISTILLMCSFPLLDVGLAVIRRYLNKQPIFSPDKNHIHHCFINKGHSHRKTVILIYVINIVFAMLAILSFYFYKNPILSSIFVLSFIIIASILIYYLKVLPRLRWFHKVK
jgi:UDP-GlcNAc:undecaprenyl-phosphate GlcNAc-1-phosphate transferase